MKALLTTALVLVAALGIALGPALAQRPKAASDPGPVDDRMARMITMMGEMREQMKQHRSEMQKLCPGNAAPQPPKKGR